MTELFVFTLLAALVAVYGTLPKHRQLRVGYGLLSTIPVFVFSVLGMVIISTYVGGVLLQPQKKTSLGTISTGFFSIEVTQVNLDLIQLGAVLGIVGIFIITFSKRSVRVRNEEILLSNLRHLYNRKEYGTLVDVIRENHSPLINHPNKPTDPRKGLIFDIMREAVEVDEDESGNRYLGFLEETFPSEDNNSEDTERVDESDSERDNDGSGEANSTKKDVHLGVEESFSNIRAWIDSKHEQVTKHITSIRAWTSDVVDDQREKVKTKYRRVGYRIDRIRYTLTETAEEANAYTESILLDPEFGREYPILDPGLGIDIIKDDSIEGIDRRRIVHQYLSTLLRTENSLLYREVENIMTHSGFRRYNIQPENRLVYSLFTDCERAKDLDVYKPIGDTAEEILDEQEKKDTDEYNERQLTSSRHSENDQYRDSIFVTIAYFDIMVREALYQKMIWHMWLYYYDSLTERICRNYKITEESDESATYPNDYSRHLFEIVDNMIGWLDALEDMVEGDEYDVRSQAEDHVEEEYMDFISLDSIDTDRGANIPKGTAICLISCHRRILTTDEVPDDFKQYITKKILEKIAELRNHNDESLLWRYSQLLIHCMEYENEERAPVSGYFRQLQADLGREVRNELRLQGDGGQSLLVELDELL